MWNNKHQKKITILIWTNRYIENGCLKKTIYSPEPVDKNIHPGYKKHDNRFKPICLKY